MYCTNCGANNNEGVKFCSNCGTPLAPAAPVATPADDEATMAFVNPVAEPAVQPAQPNYNYAEPAVSQPSQPQSPKKKGKTGLIIGIIAGLLVIAVALGAIFLTKDSDDKKKDSNKSEKTEQTEAKTEKPTEETKPAPEEKEDASYTVTVDVVDEYGTVIEEDKEVTFEIPFDYIQEYDELYDAIEFEIGNVRIAADPECLVVDGNYIVHLILEASNYADLEVEVSYSSEDMSAESINALYIEVNIQMNGSHIMVEYAVDHNGNGVATIFIDEEPYGGALSTGHTIVEGKFYDPQGNEIEEEVYAELYEKMGEEIFSYLYF